MVTMSGTTPWVSKPQGVGFAPAADKKENPERVRQPGLEPEGILHDVVVEIAGVGVEDRDLLLGGPHHPGVTVSDVGDVVRRIQVGLAVLIVKELPKAADDLERPIVRHAEIWSEAKTAELEKRGFFPRRSRRTDRPLRDPEDEFGVGAKAQPDLPLAGWSDSRKIPAFPEEVQDDLEMKVGRPAAVLGAAADGADPFAFLEETARGQSFQARGRALGPPRPRNPAA
jgi:hypothetical protein